MKKLVCLFLCFSLAASINALNAPNEQIVLLVLSCLPINLWAQAEDGLALEKPEVLSAELVYNYFDYDIVLFDEDAYYFYKCL